MNKEKLNILGINVTRLNRQQILDKVDVFLSSAKANFIITVNPEIVLTAMQDEEYFVLVNRADLAVPDGVGLTFAAWALFDHVHRFPGVDLTEILLAKAAKERRKVAILLWQEGLTRTSDLEPVLKNKYPDLNFICREISRDENQEMGTDINNFAPQLVFVALGSPWQEKVIYHQILKKDYVKLAMEVGGTFDFISGKVVRAPKLMRLLGLEWVWRVFHQAKGGRAQRAKRIYNAFFVFIMRYLQWRFILPFTYRPNVACLLFKKESSKYQILLVKRSDIDNHWQLPQGGRDGMRPEIAGKKELSEELNLSSDKIKTVASYNNLHKYKFDKNIWGKSFASPQKHGGYKGQRQSLYIAEFLGQDEDIKINYWDHNGWKWVDADNLINEVHLTRQAGYKIYLEKFKEIQEQK